jgi:hypothetical protein
LKENDLIFVKLINDTGDKDPVGVPVLAPEYNDHPMPILLPIRSRAEQLLQRAINTFLIVPSVHGLEYELPRRSNLPDGA